MTDQAVPPSPPEQAPPQQDAPPPATSAPAEGPAAPPVPAPPAWRPNYVFLAVVSFVSLAADLGTKWWAKGRLEEAKTFADRRVDVITNHLSFIFAKNRGGAFGLLQDQPEAIRRPFFLGISVLAIVFIVSLYRKLTPGQTALKWGLPLVLGGALGNLVNRIQYNYVVDFIDFRADWVRSLMGHDHWPTFNVADIAIVAGVGLMAIDMFTPRKQAAKPAAPVPPPAAPVEIAADPAAPKET